MGRVSVSGGWRVCRHVGALGGLALMLALAGCAAGGGTHPASGVPPAQVLFPKPTFTYVAIGASDAFGVGTDDPPRQCWPTVLGSQLGASVQVVNLGIPGATIAQAVRDELPIALAAQPKLITILLGTNDLVNGVPLESSLRQMQTLLVTLSQGTQATIYVGNLPDLTLLPYFSHDDQAKLRARIAEFNSALADLAASENVVVVDVYSQWADLATHPEYISADGLHPSAAGAERLARFFADAIQRQPPPETS